MQYISTYKSSVGKLLLTADNIGLTGLWIENEKYYPLTLNTEYQEKEVSIFAETKRWLDIYFSGKEPDFMPDIHMIGTEFQKEVWEILLIIPYGKTITYGEIANQISKSRGISRMSAQAVGGAVGRNKLSIIIPCHRVVGTKGNLTGYAGGIDKKIMLLKLENAFIDDFFISKHKDVNY